jgi:hypothetical protein
LQKDFDNIRFKDGESVNDNIAVLGGRISKPEIIKKMLHVAPEPLEQVAISIETMLDLDRISVE